MSMAAVVYGWDITEDVDYVLENKHPKFEEKVQNVIAELSNHKCFLNQKTMSDRYNYAFGVRLAELPYENFRLSDIMVKPSKEDKEFLMDAVSKLDDEFVKFFKKMGEPKVFVIWGESI